MSVSVQVLYPVTDGTHFDIDYYYNQHTQILNKHMGPHLERTLVTRGVADGAGGPSPFYAIATLVFANDVARGAGLAAAGPVMADLQNFTNVQPMMLMGEVQPD
jgi:uncharacterized protein (TIGR02118 family)